MRTIPTRVVLAGRAAASPDLTTTPRAWGRESQAAGRVLSTPHNETARGTHHAHATAISLHAGRGTRFSSSASLLGRSALDVCRSSATLEWRPSAGSARLAESARCTIRESRLASLVCAWLACCDGLGLSAGGALICVGEVMGVGSVKHGPCTWRVAGTEQASAQTHYASAVRHLAEALDGRTEDRDSGRHPGVHALCQIAILYDLIADPPILPGVNDGRGAFVL